MKQDWKVKTLGDVCEIGAGNSAPQDKSLFTNGVYPFFRTSDIGKIRIGSVSTAADLLNDKGIKKLKLYPKGTILLPKSGASTFLNHRVILDIDGFVSSHLATVICNEDLLDKKFALYYLIGIKAQDIIQDHGYPSLKLSDIKQIEIPIPPLKQQKQIVAKLDECFTAIDKAHENTSKNLTNTKQLFQSQLNKTFTQKGKGWVEKKLGDFCGKTSNIKWKESDSQQFEYIDLSSVSRISLSITTSTQINSSNAPSRAKKIIKTNDIIFATTRPTLKRIASINDNFNNQICSTGFVVLRSISNIIEHKFIFYFLQTDFFMKEMESAQKGTSYPAVTDNNVKSIKIQIPPIAEQKQIVAKLDALQEQTQSIESNYQNQLKSLEDLKKSLLEKAFSGGLL